MRSIACIPATRRLFRNEMLYSVSLRCQVSRFRWRIVRWSIVRCSVAQCITKLGHEEVHFFLVLARLFVPLSFRELERLLAQPFDRQTRALDDDAAVMVAEPF